MKSLPDILERIANLSHEFAAMENAIDADPDLPEDYRRPLKAFIERSFGDLDVLSEMIAARDDTRH